ncbi:MAG: MFS transporter, partial [Sphingorhabdus sp.]
MIQSIRNSPPAVRTIALVEALQRIAYVGGRALMLLMLSAPAVKQGFGWGEASALEFFGTFVALYLAAPLLGGAIADRFLGHKRSVMIGLAGQLAGNICLLASVMMAIVFTSENGMTLAQVTVGEGAKIGQVAALSIGAVQLPTFLFLLGCAAIVIGNGFYQTCAMTLIGAAYDADDPRRESGFTLHYLGQSAGFLGGALIVGTLGEVYGWVWGFAAAIFALLLAIIAMVATGSTFRPVVVAQETVVMSQAKPVSPAISAFVLTILAVFALIYTIGYEQFMGFVQLFV